MTHTAVFTGLGPTLEWCRDQGPTQVTPRVIFFIADGNLHSSYVHNGAFRAFGMKPQS